MTDAQLDELEACANNGQLFFPRTVRALIAEVRESRRDASRWQMHIKLMQRNHSANAIAQTVDVVDAALAQGKEG